MSAGITRIHGTASAGTFTGGYQIRWFKIAGTGFDTSYGTVNSNYEKAIRGVETVATVVVAGVPAAGGFIVGLDGATTFGRDDATGYAADGSTTAIDTAVTDFTGISTTVTEVAITGVTFA